MKLQTDPCSLMTLFLNLCQQLGLTLGDTWTAVEYDEANGHRY
jgi:hypothetical protein